MKKTKVLLYLLALCAAVTIVAPISGCKSSPDVITYKTEGVVINTVNSSMKAWSDYVNAGHATQAQVDKVKSAYIQYYNGQQLAKAALEKYVASKSPDDLASVNSANAAVAASQGALISLVVSLTSK